MSELSERLREAHPISQQYANGSKILLEAADEITRLQAECEKLRARETKLVEALEPFAACADELDGSPEDGIEPTDDDEWAKFRLLVSDYRRARAALAAYRQQGGEE